MMGMNAFVTLLGQADIRRRASIRSQQAEEAATASDSKEQRGMGKGVMIDGSTVWHRITIFSYCSKLARDSCWSGRAGLGMMNMQMAISQHPGGYA